MPNVTRHHLLAALGALIASAGCLEASEEDVVTLDVLLGDPEDTPFVSTLADYDSRVDDFTRNVDYLRGFAGGRPIWYWNIDGANSDVIAPTFVVVDADGVRKQSPIIDVLPGDSGYTPWWRIVEFTITDRWNGEIFTSRAAVDAGVRGGLLAGPNVRRKILNAPVSVPGVRAFDGENDRVRTSTIWYRGARTHWIALDQDIFVDVGVRRMPSLPVYIFRRIDEALPLYEFATGVDVTEDGVLNDSNNVFARELSAETYTPLWYVAEVRTTPDYLSIDTNPPARDVGLSDETQFYDLESGTIFSSNVLQVELFPERLVNCPIQSQRGEFP